MTKQSRNTAGPGEEQGWLALITGIVAEELALPSARPDDRFLNVGGHSLSAMRVIAELRDQCGVRLPLSPFSSNPSLSDLAVALEKAAREQLGDEVATRLAGSVGQKPADQ